MKDLYDLDILIENPQFIGEEEMNGILSNHFQFQLSGLGSSGAEVLANQENTGWLLMETILFAIPCW